MDTPKKTKPLTAPTKAETSLLPLFQGLTLDQIETPTSQADCQKAIEEIAQAKICGFDTEAKPTFRKGQISDGPHVVQYALTNKAFIFQLHHPECLKTAAKIIESKEILKVGFGLNNDHKQIRHKFKTNLNHTLDLDQTFKNIGYRGQIGVRGAIGVLLNQCFKKSKSTTTSNWAAKILSTRQLIYAADDAYAALKVMEALQLNGHIKP